MGLIKTLWSIYSSVISIIVDTTVVVLLTLWLTGYLTIGCTKSIWLGKTVCNMTVIW